MTPFWTHRSFWLLPVILGLILGGLSALVTRTGLRRIYKQRFPETRRERQFLASVGFFITVTLVRTITFAIHRDIGPFHDISLRGRHIHHLVWGILLLLLVGYCWLMEVGSGAEASLHIMGRLTSIVYGVGAALTLDEFALWLNLRDVYWDKEGRESFEAMAAFGSLLAVGVFGRSFFHGIAVEFASLFKRGSSRAS